MASCLVFEPRREDAALGDRGIPRGPFRAALEATEAIWSRLTDLEEEHRLPRTEVPSAALALATLHWAQGARLDSVLREADLAAGDFVRWMKQAIDLLDQVSLVAEGELGPHRPTLDRRASAAASSPTAASPDRLRRAWLRLMFP